MGKPGFRERVRRVRRNVRATESASQDTPHSRREVAVRYELALSLCPEGKIVDVGIGKGLGMKETGSGDRFLGLDYNKDALEIATETVPGLKGRLVLADAAHLPFKGVGAITAFEILEHLSAEEKERFLNEINKALKPGSLFILSTPLSFGPLKTLNRHHIDKELTLPELRSLLGRHFEGVEYYGLGEQPKTLVKKFGLRAQELLASVDTMDLRKKILPRGFRSRTMAKLTGEAKVSPLKNYLEQNKLPRFIIAVARKTKK